MNHSDLINFDWLIISTFKFLRKYFLLFVAAIILGSSVGYFISHLKKPVYSSTMIAYSSVLSDARILEILDEIKNNLEQGEVRLLASKLGLDQDVVNKIESLEIEKIESEIITETKLFIGYSQNCLKIEITVLDPKIINSIQKGIEHYLKSNEMISKALESRRRSFEELILESNKEIAKIESLQEALITSVKEGKDVFYMVEKSTTHIDKIQLLKERELFMEELEFLAPLVVIKPFSTPENPTSRYTIFSALSGLALLLISMITMGIRELNSQLLS